MKVRSKQEGEALQFTGGKESAKDIVDLVGSLGVVKYRPARTGASPAIPASSESIVITLPPPEGSRQRSHVVLGVRGWVVKTKGKVTAYTDAGFRTFWESTTIVEQVPADAYQEPHKAASTDPDQEVDDDSSNEEPEGHEGDEEAGRPEDDPAVDERDLDPSDPGDLLPDEEGPLDVADGLGEPGEVGRPE